MSYIFLDKISNQPHFPKPSHSSDESWRSALVQPVAVPNLAHTGIRSAFTFTGQPVLRPDGSISNALRRHIATEYKELPQMPTAYDPLDMAFRDKEKRRRKARLIKQRVLEAKRAREEQLHLEQENERETEGKPELTVDVDALQLEPSLTETQLSAMSKIMTRRPVSPERQKKPFSNDSLFNALLDSQVGGNGDRWDLNDMLR